MDIDEHYINKQFDMIVATDLNWGIGINNGLLALVKQDMEFFKARTMNHVVIMGRKTAESLPHGYLNGRINVILSHSFGDNVDVSHIDESTTIIKINGINKLLRYISLNYPTKKPYVVIGGRSIYVEFLQRELIDRIFLTTYFKKFKNVDTYIPDLSTLGFKHDLTNPNHVITGYELPQKAIVGKSPINMRFTIHTLTLTK